MRRAFLSILIACFFGASALGQQTPQTGEASCRLLLQAGELDTRWESSLLDARKFDFAKTHRVILQLTGPINARQRTRLQKLGVVLHEYVPDHAYIADVKRVSRDELAAIPFVQWLGEYRREWKCSPRIGKRIAPLETPERIELAESGRVRLMITLFAHEDPKTAIVALRKRGATVHGRERVADSVVIFADISEDRVESLADIKTVQLVEEAPEITLRNNTTRWIVQSNVSQEFPFYDHGLRGENQIIGIMDGRPDVHHCSLDGGKFLFYNSFDGNSSHGTHVACTAAGNNGVDDSRRGVAYGSKMVFSPVPSFTESGISTNLELHHSQGARIHTNSWGDDGTTAYNGLCRGFDDFLYQNEDDFACLAVTNGSTLRNPENAKNLLAVGASQDTPNQQNHCSGGIGPTADGRRKPEIYAPGCNTISAVPSACNVLPSTGTSMACPAVAGTATLVRQYFMEGFYPSGVANLDDAFTPSGALIKAVLINSAVDMTGIGGYPSNLEGWGRLLADNAVYFAGDATHLVVLDDLRNASGLSTEQVEEYAVTVLENEEQLRVTLVYTDPPASASTGSSAALVNNLDLEVVSPEAQLYRGNVFVNGQSAPNGSADSVNNVEQVHVSGPTVGEWTIRIKGTVVNQGAQGFALIATGSVASEPPDCNTNGVPDFEDIGMGISPDCDGDGVPDECQPQDDCNTNGVQDICDIANKSSDDCSGNGVPDECESDCNDNGIADSCDIIGPTSSDCNANHLPDDCETDCNGNGIPDDCDIATGEPDCNENIVPDACEVDGAFGHDCCEGSVGKGCSDASIEACVCATDPYCCEVNWDGICAYRVEQYGCGTCTVPVDCDSNSIPDECEADCNANGIVDACDIGGATSTDCNVNAIPDECETPDCNGNGVLDECDLAGETSSDCNENLVPDDCEIEIIGPGDCCEIEHGPGCSNPTIQACVCDDAPSCCDDEWDEFCVGLVEQFGCGSCEDAIDPDCDDSGVLDVCEAHDDCNGNGKPDVCDEPDCNENDIPDDCETGDLILAQPLSTSVCPLATAQFVVNAPQATAFQWYQDGLPLADSVNVSGSMAAILSIANAGESAVGSYHCVVSIGCMNLESDVVELAISPEPSIVTQPPASDSSCTDTTVIVVIEAVGYQLQYQWLKDGEPILNSQRVSGAKSASLTIDDLSSEDQADQPGYSCVITDGCGRSVESEAMTLSIVGPIFTNQPTDTCADPGEVATMTATAVSPDGLTQFTQWFKDGNPIVDSSRVTGSFTDTLTIDPIQASDAGVYEQRALTIGPNCFQFSEEAELTVGDCCLAPGDMDSDGDYDLFDMHLFSICFGQNIFVNPSCGCADIDGISDVINQGDWDALSGLIDGP